MRLLEAKPGPRVLQKIGTEVAALIHHQRYDELADRFGYAEALDRPAAQAIREDINECLAVAGPYAELDNVERVVVESKFYEPNREDLYALVECVYPLRHAMGHIMIEIAITIAGKEKHAIVRDVTYAQA